MPATPEFLVLTEAMATASRTSIWLVSIVRALSPASLVDVTKRPTSQAIADQLDISIRTGRNKLGVHSQLKAVLFALRYAVIDER